MFTYARWRSWHKWAGLLLLAPVIVIAATGFLWNHEKSLGLKAMKMKGDEHAPRGKDNFHEAPLVIAPDAWRSHAANIDKALSACASEWGENAPLERIELKDEPGYGMVVKVKVSPRLDLDMDQPEEIVWSTARQTVVARKGIAAERDWAELVHDLHTGKFFGKQYGFFWSDAGSVAIVFLGGSGVILFAVPLVKKRKNRKRRQQVEATVTDPPRKRLRTHPARIEEDTPTPIGISS